MAAVLLEPVPELRDIWKLLWHIDVKKDHETDYDSDIVNKLLPNTKFERDLENYGGKPAGTNANDTVTLPTPKDTFNKDWIMNYVLRRQEGGKFLYPDLFTSGEFTNKDSPVRIVSYPLGLQYEVITVPIDSAKEYVNTISEFFQGVGEPRMYLSYDTGAHIEDVLQNANMANVFDAYTRASQSDPAGKPSTEKLGEKLYIEQAQPLAITYPSYSDTPTFPLAHFYCKYTVNLIQHPDAVKRAEGRLNVSMTYVKDTGEVIYVVEGANTAGAARKQKVLQKKGFQFTKIKDGKSNEKEMIFISKLHGDVAQGLEEHRTIALERGVPPIDTVTTEGSRFCFVSIDQNALTKYFTTGGTYAMFYKLEGAASQIALFRPLNMNPAVEFDYLKKRAVEFVTKINEDINLYNSSIAALNQRRADLPAIVNALLSESVGATDSEKYANIIKNGARIAAILPFVPKEVLNFIPTNGLDDEIARLLAYELPAGGIVAGKAELERIRKVFADREKLFQFPIGHIAVDPFINVEGRKTIKPSSIETDLIVKISNGAVTAKTVDRLWKTINVEYNPRGRSLRAVFCRVGAKHTTYWCLDVLRQTYALLSDYNSAMADFYIFALEQQINSKESQRETWLDALNIVGLTRVAGRASVGGGGNTSNNVRTLKNKNNRRGNNSRYNNNVTRRLSKNVNVSEGEEEPSVPNTLLNVNAEEPIDEADHLLRVIESETNDIDAVADFYTDMLTVGEDSEKIQDLHMKFFNRIYDDLSGLPELPELQEGGARSEYALAAAAVEEVDILEEDDGSDVSFFMTVPAIVTYIQTLKSLEQLLEKVSTFRRDELREKRIEELKTNIQTIKNKLKSLEEEKDLPAETNTAVVQQLQARETEDDERLRVRIDAKAVISTLPPPNTIKSIIEYMKLQLSRNRPIEQEDRLITEILTQRGAVVNEMIKKDVSKYIRILIGKREGNIKEAKETLAYIFKLNDPEYLTEFGFDLPSGGSRKRRYQNRKTQKARKRKIRRSLKMKRRTV